MAQPQPPPAAPGTQPGAAAARGRAFTTRLLWGALPMPAAFLGMVVQNTLALRRPVSTHGPNLSQLAVSDGAGAAVTLACVAVLVRALVSAPTKTAAATAARAAAASHVLGNTIIAYNISMLKQYEFCPAVIGRYAACADVAFTTHFCSFAFTFALVYGLPARLAFGAELARGGLVTAIVLAKVWWHDGLDAAWAARWLLNHIVLAAAVPLLLRAAALQAAEPPSLAELELCPAALRPARDALMRAGDRLQQLGLLSRALLAAVFVYSWVSAGREMLGRSAPGSAAPRVLAAAALLLSGSVRGAWQLRQRRSERARLIKRRVHGLHVRLALLDRDPEALLAAAADFLLAALPPGASFALAEWEPSSDGADGAQPTLCVLRTAARAPAGSGAEEALRAAVAAGCAPGGSARAALAHADCGGGFTLASEDCARGARQHADWAALTASASGGTGAVSTSLLGIGINTAGGLWVHTPPSVDAPSPALLFEVCECVGVALLRSRAARALLAVSVADAAARARADADATLALQRRFMSGITHELRTPLNAVIGFTSTVLEETARLEDHLVEHLRCSHTAANGMLSIVNQARVCAELWLASCHLDC
jgi:hypothetical protein